MSLPVHLADSLADARSGSLVEVTGDEAHHAVAVRRLRVGEAVLLTDGAGTAATGTVEETGKRRFAVRLSDVRRDGRPDPELVVVQALPKGERGELAVEVLTEVGVDRIVPFRAARSVVRWDDAKGDAARRRWIAVARSAVEQSKGCWLPEVAPIADVAALAAAGAVRVDRGGEAPSLARSVVAVGPEGGWDEEERDLLPTAVALGPNVLRAETAALTAGVLLCSLRSGLVR